MHLKIMKKLLIYLSLFVIVLSVSNANQPISNSDLLEQGFLESFKNYGLVTVIASAKPKLNFSHPELNNFIIRFDK